MTITIGMIAEWAEGRLTSDDVNREVRGFSTDTRTIKKGELFIALKGPNFDGHDYVNQAFEKGACGALVSYESTLGENVGVVVGDTLRALGDMAHRYRWEVDLIPWIGITGSNGKTTTREMLCKILSTRGKVAHTQGNFNNLIGMPMAILNRPKDAWIGVVEMGASEPGEIARLAEIATPTVSIVTSIGSSHLLGFGSQEAVAHEKADIYHKLPQDGVAIYPANASHIDVIESHITAKKATFSLEGNADMVAENIQTTSEGVQFTVRGIDFALPLLGKHNISNCLAALLAAEHFGVPLKEAAENLKKIRPVHERLEIIQTEYFTIINDVYNANPSSLNAAIEVLKSFTGRRKIVVIGDMLELGEKSRELHQEAGRMLSSSGIEVIIGIGKETIALAEAARNASAKNIVRHFRTIQALIRRDEKIAHPGDVILVKGSRGMKMEEIVDELIVWEPE